MNNTESIIMDIQQRLTKIEVMLSEKVSNLDERVSKLESNQAWLVRLLIGGIVTAVLALIGLNQ